MAVSDLIQQARTRFGQSPSVLLRAEEPTGEKPWEMFVTDEHTEHYLALKAGGDTDRGMLTGAVGGTGGLVMIMPMPNPQGFLPSGGKRLLTKKQPTRARTTWSGLMRFSIWGTCFSTR